MGGLFKKGEAANPNGRPKGSRNKRDLVVEDLTAKAITEGLMPLEFFLTVLRNPAMPLGFRFECGKAAAPYVHQKRPIQIENLDAPFKVLDVAQLENLSDEDLEHLQRIMAKAAQAAAKPDPALDPRVITVPTSHVRIDPPAPKAPEAPKPTRRVPSKKVKP